MTPSLVRKRLTSISTFRPPLRPRASAPPGCCELNEVLERGAGRRLTAAAEPRPRQFADGQVTRHPVDRERLTFLPHPGYSYSEQKFGFRTNNKTRIWEVPRWRAWKTRRISCSRRQRCLPSCGRSILQSLSSPSPTSRGAPA